MLKNIKDKIYKFFNWLYLKLVKIDDTPQKIALGFGLGVFVGILPGTGPLVALFLAFIFKVNRASALLGSLLTNTWLSFVTFILAIKIGSAIFNLSWQELEQGWISLLKEFSWQSLFKVSLLKIVLPTITGFFIVSFFLGVLTYSITLIIIKRRRKHGN
ncbi:MAG: DUF2062 domain-containing protein [Candidatus Omnitrophica bacterium]|nr:DUF2062 domain-containing protein [Candidatus Omnitrophota bacterium]